VGSERFGVTGRLVGSNNQQRLNSRNVKARNPTSSKSADFERQLKDFIGKFEPAKQRLIRAVRKRMRARFPTAHELVYDNYNFFVIGYSPTERPSDSIFSIAAAANGVGFCFIRGASLTDPKKVLLGSGNQTRFIRLPSPDVLDQADVGELIDAAVASSKAPFPRTGKGRLIIRSVSKTQRPRRKLSK
jgi:hypothetical protein